jgi:hypothetical protein
LALMLMLLLLFLQRQTQLVELGRRAKARSLCSVQHEQRAQFPGRHARPVQAMHRLVPSASRLEQRPAQPQASATPLRTAPMRPVLQLGTERSRAARPRMTAPPAHPPKPPQPPNAQAASQPPPPGRPVAPQPHTILERVPPGSKCRNPSPGCMRAAVRPTAGLAEQTQPFARVAATDRAQQHRTSRRWQAAGDSEPVPCEGIGCLRSGIHFAAGPGKSDLLQTEHGDIEVLLLGELGGQQHLLALQLCRVPQLVVGKPSSDLADVPGNPDMEGHEYLHLDLAFCREAVGPRTELGEAVCMPVGLLLPPSRSPRSGRRRAPRGGRADGRALSPRPVCRGPPRRCRHNRSTDGPGPRSRFLP